MVYDGQIFKTTTEDYVALDVPGDGDCGYYAAALSLAYSLGSKFIRISAMKAWIEAYNGKHYFSSSKV